MGHSPEEIRSLVQKHDLIQTEAQARCVFTRPIESVAHYDYWPQIGLPARVLGACVPMGSDLGLGVRSRVASKQMPGILRSQLYRVETLDSSQW